MRLEGEILLVVPALGVVIATLTQLRALGRWGTWSFVAAVLAGLLPLVILARPETGRSTGRALWEWSTAGGPVVHAAYHVDPLAVVGASVVALVSIATLRLAGRAEPRRTALPALVLAQSLALFALVSVTDLVAAALVSGSAAALAGAIGFLVARPAAAARLSALLALGVQAITAVALLVARFGIPTFDLDAVPPRALGADALAAMALGAALFCGLYPFVPWRYEPRSRTEAAPQRRFDGDDGSEERRDYEPRSRTEAAPQRRFDGDDGSEERSDSEPIEAGATLAALRGALTFPTGVAGSVLALRVIGASDRAPTAFALPELGDATRLAIAVAVALVTAGTTVAAHRSRATRETLAARLLTGVVLLLLLAAYPALRWSHLMALLALTSVGYASLASAVVPEEWAVARFDARLGTLWAAIALGTAPALGGALFAMVASAGSLALEAVPLPPSAARTARASARVLAVVGPLTALFGIRGAPDPGVAALAGAALLWAALVEAGHALREARADAARAARVALVFDALAAYAAALVVGVTSAVAIAAATKDVLPTGVPWSGAYFGSLALAFAVVASLLLAAPELASAPRVPAGFVRAALAAADPVPGALMVYRAMERLSSRFAIGFAMLEERAGVWLATLLIGLTLLWAAAS